MTNSKTCPAPEQLLRYIAGPGGERALPDGERAQVESHAAGCPPCRETMLALGLATSEGTPEEEALLRELLAATPAPERPGHGPAWLSPRQRFPRGLFLAGAAATVAAAAAAFALFPRGPAPEELLLGLALAERPTEARSSLELPYAPFRPTRGAAPATALDPVLSELLRAKQRDPAAAARPLAMLYLLRGEAGDLGRAEAELAGAPGAASENERGVLALASGRLPEALGAFDRAVALDPTLRAAAFNRAVVLERLGKRDAALAAWRGFLGGAGPADAGWVEEARARLSALER